jgi:hypothetical protein
MAFQRADRRLLLISRRRSKRPALSSWAHQRMDPVSACGGTVRGNCALFKTRRSTLPRISYDGASPGTPAMAARELELAGSALLPGFEGAVGTAALLDGEDASTFDAYYEEIRSTATDGRPTTSEKSGARSRRHSKFFIKTACRNSLLTRLQQITLKGQE